jgi:hypothetical protein
MKFRIYSKLGAYTREARGRTNYPFMMMKLMMKLMMRMNSKTYYSNMRYALSSRRNRKR